MPHLQEHALVASWHKQAQDQDCSATTFQARDPNDPKAKSSQPELCGLQICVPVFCGVYLPAQLRTGWGLLGWLKRMLLCIPPTTPRGIAAPTLVLGECLHETPPPSLLGSRGELWAELSSGGTGCRQSLPCHLS